MVFEACFAYAAFLLCYLHDVYMGQVACLVCLSAHFNPGAAG